VQRGAATRSIRSDAGTARCRCSSAILSRIFFSSPSRIGWVYFPSLISIALNEGPNTGRLHAVKCVCIPKTPKGVRKSRVLRFAAVASPACMNSRVGSSQWLPADCAAGWAVEIENLALRHQLHVLRRQRPGGPACSRSTAYSGSGCTEYGRVAWTRWCWSSPPPSFNGTVKAFAYSGVGVRDPDGPQRIARFSL
jgi:hypothetical protein